MDNYGIKVDIVFSEHWRDLGGSERETLRNVTEVHYRHGGQDKVAFESDFHGTGMNYYLADIVEFETRPETEIADEF